MKREITISLITPQKPETTEQIPEEFTVYGTGAGLYSHLNILAEKIMTPGLERIPFEVSQ